MNVDKFIQKPVLSTVISIFIVLLGVLGLISLPIEQYPSIAPPTIQVQTFYQGADAQTVLNSVIAPLEEQINGVEGMTYMTSSATNTGQATITVYFKEDIDPDMAAVNVQNRVSQAQALLPSEVTAVGVVTSKRQSSMLLVFSLTSSDGRYDAEFLANYADINVLPVLKRVPGVGAAQSFSTQTYSMRIWLNPDEMKQRSLMPSDVRTALATQNFEAAPGALGVESNNTYEYTLRYGGRLKTAEAYGDIIISANAKGEITRLKDVARIELGSLAYSMDARTNGQPSVTGMVNQVAGSNANDIIKQIKREVDELKEDFPPGMEFKYILDVTDFLYASIGEVVKTLIEAFLLVFIVVYLFLQDVRSTLIPAIAVPVSLIGTFAVLSFIGFSLNLLTLSALVLAIAIVVDDAIVVVEAVHAKLDEGYKSAYTASVDAMHEITGAIISITLVMAAVFVPVSFISGVSGAFYREFGITMAVSIVISAVNALTLSPALCAILLKPHDKHQAQQKSVIARFHTAFNTFYEHRVLKPYKRGVEFFIGHKVIAGTVVLASLIGLGLLMTSTSTGLVPDEDTGSVFVVVSTPPGTTLEKTQAKMGEIQKMISAIPAVETVTEIIGYSFIGGAGSNYGTLFVRLKPFEERHLSLWDKILIGLKIKEFDGVALQAQSVVGMAFLQTMSLKDVTVIPLTPPMIPGYSSGSGVSMSMQDRTGGDINKFYAQVQTFLGELQKRPEVQYAMTQYDPRYPQYMVDVDVATAVKHGTTPATVLSTLQGYFGGLYVSNFNAYGKLYRVMLQAGSESRLDPNALNAIYVRNDKGQMMPITTFIKLTPVQGPTSINRFNMFTSIDLTIAPNVGYSSGDVLKAIEEVSAQTLSQGYTYEYSGLTRSEQESSSTTGIVFALCLLFVYLLLAAQYESYLLPFAVVLSIPFGLAGAFIFTNLFGHSNNIYMQIALIMLIGLLAKNAILIVEFALERRRMGMAVKWSAVLGAAARLRPILMTSLAMIVGLLPLMFASGVGAEGNGTLGASTVGGMLIGMILQVLIVPALFVIFQFAQEKFKPIKFDDIIDSRPSGEVLQFSRPKEDTDEKK
ncbi:MAG: efflux RND transporter permease subunit [Bacteroidales bacterium]|nr:efflux RND transporter permease subunit [Bacteroidales bacterium]